MATETAVKAFQRARGLPVSGIVEQPTMDALAKPMRRLAEPVDANGGSPGSTTISVARRHLAEHPREIGGPNAGPWVRLYTGGKEGREWLWCAGFVSFIVREAAQATGSAMPIKSCFSCDMLAADAQRRGSFVSEKQATRGDPRALVPPGSVFLQRRTPGDWVHTGLVTGVKDGVVETIEGNTNDSGDREGYEVCKRFRALRNMDFIPIA